MHHALPELHRFFGGELVGLADGHGYVPDIGPLFVIPVKTSGWRERPTIDLVPYQMVPLRTKANATYGNTARGTSSPGCGIQPA